MELFDPFNAWGLFFIVWGAIFVVALIVGVIVAAFDHYGDGEAIGIGAVFGVFVGFIISLIVIGSSVDERNANIRDTFEETYQVSIVEGGVPHGANDRDSLLMFTKDGGPFACIVSTDDVGYTVVCDGDELRPVDVK